MVRDPETGADVTPISLLDASKPTLPDTQLALVDDAAERGSQGSGGFDRASAASASGSISRPLNPTIPATGSARRGAT